MDKSILKPLRPLFACLLMIAFCSLFNAFTPERNVVSTEFQRDYEQAEFDTVRLPYWRMADTLYFDSIQGDLRMTDTWCDIAGASISHHKFLVDVYSGYKRDRYKDLDTVEFPHWKEADINYKDRYSDRWEEIATEQEDEKNVITTPKKLWEGHTCSDEDRGVTFKK